MLQSSPSHKIINPEKHDSICYESNESSLNLDNFDFDSQVDSPKEKPFLKKDLIESKIISFFEEAFHSKTKTKPEADITFMDLFNKHVYKQEGSKKLQELLDKLEVDECTYIYSFVREIILYYT